MADSLLTDGQVMAIAAAIVGCGGTIGAMLRWGVNRIVKALDDSSATSKAQAEAFVRLETRVETLVRVFTREPEPEPEPTPVLTGRRTPVEGVPIGRYHVRPKTDPQR